MTSRRIITIASLALAVALGAWLWLKPQSLAVDVARVERGPLLVTVDDDGETRVRNRFVVSAPVAGKLARLSCEEGTAVAAGMPVAVMYPLPLDARTRREATERIEAADALAGEARARLRETQAAGEQAQSEYERVRELASKQLVPARELEIARAAQQSTAAAVRAQQLRVDAAEHERAIAAAILQTEKSSASGITIRAPASGRVLRIQQECERVITAGTPIMEIGDPRDIEIVIDVLSDDAENIRPGAQVLISSGEAVDTFTGRVRLVEPSAFIKVSPLGVEEHRVNVIVDPDSVPPGLGDRFRVQARIITSRADAVLSAPASAIFRAADGWATYAVRDGRAHKVAVEIARRGGGRVEIVRGLSVGEEVVAHPSSEIAEGVRIRARSTM